MFCNLTLECYYNGSDRYVITWGFQSNIPVTLQKHGCEIVIHLLLYYINIVQL
jgi:hypothetical protein